MENQSAPCSVGTIVDLSAQLPLPPSSAASSAIFLHFQLSRGIRVSDYATTIIMTIFATEEAQVSSRAFCFAAATTIVLWLLGVVACLLCYLCLLSPGFGSWEEGTRGGPSRRAQSAPPVFVPAAAQHLCSSSSSPNTPSIPLTGALTHHHSSDPLHEKTLLSAAARVPVADKIGGSHVRGKSLALAPLTPFVLLRPQLFYLPSLPSR
ncbi:unnamed protein product [Calypogeia fissa]